MTEKALLFILFVSIFCELSLAEVSSDKWDNSNQKILRLQPEIFDILPDNILKGLKERNCTIPQSYTILDPHNVIQGQFQVKDEMAWAVLCSISKISSILIFRGENMRLVSEIAKSPDKNWLQVIGDRKIGYSRQIKSITGYSITDHYQVNDGPKPPLFDHEGIDDAFLEKGSIVHYWYNGNWLELTAAD
jgi:hypothetical protein